jgi:hypothetical protein
MFLFGVGRVGNRLAGTITHRDVGDGVAARAVFRIAKAGMVGIEVDDSDVDVIQQYGFSFDWGHGPVLVKKEKATNPAWKDWWPI